MGAVVIVACGVLGIFDIKIFHTHFFGDASGEESFALLGHYVGNQAFFRFEIVGHGFCLVGAALVFKHGVACHLAGGVDGSNGIHFALVHIHIQAGGGELDAAISDVAVAKHARIVFAIHHNGVFSRKVDHMVEVHSLFLKPRGVGHRLLVFGLHSG